MSNQRRVRVGSVTASAVLVAALAGVTRLDRRERLSDSPRLNSSAKTLAASLRAEPRSFNRYVSRDLSTAVVTLMLHDGLIRINRVTNEIQPALAERWQLLADRRTYRMWLRPNVRFSDGVPFTAADVEFSFRAIYDRTVDSVLADSLEIGGRPLTVVAETDSTLTVRFPTPFGPGLRVLDGVPIYPRHRLEAALRTGTFRSVWGLATPTDTLVGLGPFVLREYRPGQQLTFDRNPYYWDAARQRPELQRVVLDIVTDQQAELLQLETGAIDLTQAELGPADAAALRRESAAGRIAVTDAGVGMDGDLFWLNLTPGKSSDPRSAWLQHRDFRRAIAHAVNRQQFVDTVYMGAAAIADSIISPGNRQWHEAAPLPSYDVAAARQMLAALGLRPRHDDGMLADRSGRAVKFTLMTQKGNASLERGAFVIRDSLAKVGVEVDVVALEVGTLIEYITRGDYDAAYFRLLTTDTDPALNLDFWLSSGDAHMWNPRQRVPATRWEAQIDDLMTQVSTTLDPESRHASFAQVERIMSVELPVLCFAFPRLYVAVSSRVMGATPAAFRPPVLWNPSVLAVRTAR